MTKGFPIMIQYLFKKYEAFPYHQKQFPITNLTFLVQKETSVSLHGKNAKR
jgi:hypothetical protein